MSGVRWGAAAMLALVFVSAACGRSQESAPPTTPTKRERGPAPVGPVHLPDTALEQPDEEHGQRGLCSFYGRYHHGKRTASGERFDMHDMTAAHRKLPFGTRVRVENLENGKTVEVRVNDRGPFGRRKRIMDLSQAAAQAIDMISSGVVKCRVTIIP